MEFLSKCKLLTIALFVSVFWVQAQETPCGMLWPEKTPIAVYETATSHEPVSYFVQGACEDIWFNAYIIDTSTLRFKVTVSLELGYQSNYSQYIGWVNKSNVVVTPLVNKYVDGVGIIELYSDPADTTYDAVNRDELPPVVTVLDYKYVGDKLWAKITYTHEDHIVECWINRHCDNVYQSCN